MNGAKRYTITVKAKIERTGTVGGRWEKLGQDVAPGNPEKLVDKMGYTPQVEMLTTEDVQIYEQVVDELDIAALVQVVNGSHR